MLLEVKSFRGKTKARLIPARKIFEYFTELPLTIHFAMYRFFIIVIDPIGKYWVHCGKVYFRACKFLTTDICGNNAMNKPNI